jgi:hypothetical protein
VRYIIGVLLQQGVEAGMVADGVPDRVEPEMMN